MSTPDQKRKPRWPLLSGVLIAVLFISGFVYVTTDKRTASGTAYAFLSSLADGNIDTAKGLAGGPVAARLNHTDAGLSVNATRLADVAIRAVAWGEDHAQVAARIETEALGGRWDVQWFDVVLARDEEHAWRVVGLARTGADISGHSRPVSNRFDPAAFSGYLATLASGDYAGAKQYLAGPALAAHEQGAAALGVNQVPIFSEHTEPTYTPVWANNRLVMVRAEYEVDARPVTALVTFYRLEPGWRVVGVQGQS